MGSFLLRMIHLLIWVAHAALLFVDDFFVAQDKSVLPATGAMICLFFQILGFPLSWKKLMFGMDRMGVQHGGHVSLAAAC